MSNAELDALYARFLEQPAQLTTAQVNVLERRLCTADAEWRKLALASLAKSGVELKERFAGSREAAQLAAELLTVADDMGKRLHEIAAMLETASTRLMLSLCERPDMQELIAAARAQLERGALPPTGEQG
jgi:hydrogenase maturation factor